MCLYTGCTFNSAPDLVTLLELLADVNHLWYEIGTVLKVPTTTLESLQQKSTTESIKMNKVIQCWINQRTTKVTWGNIIAALKSKNVQQNRVAEEIERHVLNTNQGGETPTKRSVALDVSTSSKKYSRAPVEPQRSEYSMLLQ